MNNNLYNINIKGIPGEVKQATDNRVYNWQKLKYGMFIHWGIYSQIGGVWNNAAATEGYSEQIQMWENISKDEYLKEAESFVAKEFDPKLICQLAKESGMKYIVLTTKHHDGFCMFDTETTDYNIVEQTPFGKDALYLLAKECQKQGLKLGIYYSLVDWSQGHSFDPYNSNPISTSIENLIKEQLKELLMNYGSIVELWFDMGSPTLEQSEKIVSLVRKYQPETMINSRIWNNVGDFRTLSDNELPDSEMSGAWQTPASINHDTWGYRSWQEYDVFFNRLNSLLSELIKVCANGGNYLLNIGPRGDGTLVEYEVDALRAVGEWIKRHPEIVNGNKTTKFPVQSWGHVMVNDRNLFLYLTNIPSNNKIVLSGLATPALQVIEDNFDTYLTWEQDNYELSINLPPNLEESFIPVLKVKLSDDLYVIPEKVVFPNSKIWSISNEDISYSYSYVDSGNYFSTELSTVKLEAFIATRKKQELLLEFHGEVDLNSDYNIRVGNQEKVISGKQLQEEKIGFFSVSASEIIPLVITLANPRYKGENINMNVNRIVVSIKNDV